MISKILIALCFATSAYAAETKVNSEKMDPKTQAMMEAWTKAGAVGEQHKILAQMSGKWKTTSKYWHSANATPEETKGTDNSKVIFGGRFIQSEFKGKAMGQNFEGMGLNGFDNVSQTFESTWIDNMSTSIMKMTGTYDEATKTINQKGQFMDPVTKQMKTSRGETKFVGKNEFMYTMYSTGDDGKEFKCMEISYKR